MDLGEKIGYSVFCIFMVVFCFWPLAAIPVITEQVLHWQFRWNWTGWIALGAIGGWLLWDFFGFLADIDEVEGNISLFWGLVRRYLHERNQFHGYMAD